MVRIKTWVIHNSVPMLDVFSKVKNLPICPSNSPQRRDLLSISNQRKRWAYCSSRLGRACRRGARIKGHVCSWGTSRTSAHVRVASEMRRMATFAPGEIDEYGPLAAQGEGVICPTGAPSKILSSGPAKNISLHPSGKSSLQIRAVPPHRGAYRDRHGRGVRMRWTRQRFACAGLQGR